MREVLSLSLSLLPRTIVVFPSHTLCLSSSDTLPLWVLYLLSFSLSLSFSISDKRSLSDIIFAHTGWVLRRVCLVL